MSSYKIGRAGLPVLITLVMLFIPAYGFCAGQGSVFENLTEDSPQPDCYHEWMFPDSDKEYLEKADLAGLTKDQLWWARNEIFARHGYIFKSDKGKKYVQSLGTCYTPRHGDADAMMKNEFNDYERRNVELIRKIESSK